MTNPLLTINSTANTATSTEIATLNIAHTSTASDTMPLSSSEPSIIDNINSTSLSDVPVITTANTSNLIVDTINTASTKTINTPDSIEDETAIIAAHTLAPEVTLYQTLDPKYVDKVYSLSAKLPAYWRPENQLFNELANLNIKLQPLRAITNSSVNADIHAVAGVNTSKDIDKSLNKNKSTDLGIGTSKYKPYAAIAETPTHFASANTVSNLLPQLFRDDRVQRLISQRMVLTSTHDLPLAIDANLNLNPEFIATEKLSVLVLAKLNQVYTFDELNTLFFMSRLSVISYVSAQLLVNQIPLTPELIIAINEQIIPSLKDLLTQQNINTDAVHPEVFAYCAQTVAQVLNGQADTVTFTHILQDNFSLDRNGIIAPGMLWDDQVMASTDRPEFSIDHTWQTGSQGIGWSYHALIIQAVPTLLRTLVEHLRDTKQSKVLTIATLRNSFSCLNPASRYLFTSIKNALLTEDTCLAIAQVNRYTHYQPLAQAIDSNLLDDITISPETSYDFAPVAETDSSYGYHNLVVNRFGTVFQHTKSKPANLVQQLLSQKAPTTIDLTNYSNREYLTVVHELDQLLLLSRSWILLNLVTQLAIHNQQLIITSTQQVATVLQQVLTNTNNDTGTSTGNDTNTTTGTGNNNNTPEDCHFHAQYLQFVATLLHQPTTLTSKPTQHISKLHTELKELLEDSLPLEYRKILTSQHPASINMLYQSLASVYQALTDESLEASETNLSFLAQVRSMINSRQVVIDADFSIKQQLQQLIQTLDQQAPSFSVALDPAKIYDTTVKIPKFYLF